MASINDLVLRMKYRLSRQQDSSIDARIVDELAAAQDGLENGTTLPWFLLTQQSYSAVGPHDSFSLSNYPGFLRISEDDFGFQVEDLTRTDETLVKLTKQDTYGQMLRYSSGYADEATLPDSYCVLGTVIHVRKKQVVDRKYYLSYFRRDTTLPAVGATTLWSQNVPELLLAEAGIPVSRYLRDNESMQYFTAMRTAKFAELVRRNQALQDADQSYVMDE